MRTQDARKQDSFVPVCRSGGDKAKLLETIEQALDQVAIAVQMRVECPGGELVGSRRDDRLRAAGFDHLDQRVGVVTLVGDHGLGRQRLD